MNFHHDSNPARPGSAGFQLRGTRNSEQDAPLTSRLEACATSRGGRRVYSVTLLLPALVAALLFTGCKKQEGAAAEAEAHGVTKDGVAMCTEHGVPEAECAVCKPHRADKLQPGESMKLRLPSTNSTTMVGVETATPEIGTMADGVECVAEVSFNQNKLAQIAAPVGGIVQTVDVDLGTRVEENQTVAKLWSASIAEAVAKAVLSHQTMNRERKLRTERVTSEKDLQEAEAAHRSACQQLRTLGFTEAQVEELSVRPQEQVLMEVRAPFAGEIIERMAVRGALVEAANRSSRWWTIQRCGRGCKCRKPRWRGCKRARRWNCAWIRCRRKCSRAS